MKLRWKHLRHPVRSAASAKCRLQAGWANRRLLYQGARRFNPDPRYDLDAVTRGFRPLSGDSGCDRQLLQRICRAYCLATSQERIAAEKYNPTPWWQQQRTAMLRPVMQALCSHDVDTLQSMYANFYRDDCATGLLPVQRVKGHYFGDTIRDVHRRLCLVDALYRLDYWTAQTDGRYSLRELAGPGTGNPWGVVLEDTLLREGAVYQHYCAQRIARLLPSGRATIAEIGGGFGGMAYYLLRDRPGTTYIDFDVPESIALASYYLLKSFPGLKVVLYGETDLNAETISKADIILVPIFQLECLPDRAVDLSFSSHALSDVKREFMPEYLSDIARITRNHFLYVGSERFARSIADVSTEPHGQFALLESRPSGWSDHIAPAAGNVEQIYGVTGREATMSISLSATAP